MSAPRISVLLFARKPTPTFRPVTITMPFQVNWLDWKNERSASSMTRIP
jgi:hypothetical protein